MVIAKQKTEFVDLREEQFDRFMLQRKIPQKCLEITEYLLNTYSELERIKPEENYFYLDMADLNLTIAENYGFTSRKLRFRLKSYMEDYET